MTIGNNIRKIRIEKGLTQRELGSRCGMTDSAIRRYELSNTQPTARNLKKIAEALGVSVNDLLPALDLGTDVIERDPKGNIRSYNMDDPEDKVALYLNHMDARGRATVVTVAQEIARSQGYRE